MDRTPSSIQSPRLRPASSANHYDLHMAALEWSLAEPIIINSAEEIQSRTNWHEKVEPFAQE